MEDFQSHLVELHNVPFTMQSEIPASTSDSRNSRLYHPFVSESEMQSYPNKTLQLSTLPLPVYQHSGLQYGSSQPPFLPQVATNTSTSMYSEKYMDHYSLPYANGAVDMTNRNISGTTSICNTDHADSGIGDKAMPNTKYDDRGLACDISGMPRKLVGNNYENITSADKAGDTGRVRMEHKTDTVVKVSEKTGKLSLSSDLSMDSQVMNENKSCDEESNINDVNLYHCGGCLQKFYIICKLHNHIKIHNQDGSYYYSEVKKTAYPKFDTCCTGTQTEDLKYKRKRSKIIAEMREESHDTSKTANSVSVKTEEEELIVDLVDGFVKDTVVNYDVHDIKYEKNDCEYVSNLNRADGSGSDTDEYNAKETLAKRPKTRQKSEKRKSKSKGIDKKASKVKGSKKLKQLKMTIKLKQERNEKRLLFHRKEKKPKLKVRREKIDDKIVCKLCDINFQKRLLLRHHIKEKHSDMVHLCSLCSENFTTDEALVEHRKDVHNRGFHQCELCDKVLSTKGMLEGHYLVHKGIKPFACAICEPKREFTRKCQLKAHMDTHSTEKTLQCEFCGKPFNARYLMLNHVKHCGGIKPHQCDYCEMRFVSNHCLQRHRRTHTGEKPFVCEVCAFASSNASCLARHLRTHTGEKPFVCEYCKQSFAARGALKKHVRIHTQEKPYKCRYCTKAFTQNWNLKTHERQHTGETPYKCHVCGVGYKQNVLLKTHIKTHYGSNTDTSESQNLALNQSVSQDQIESLSSVQNQSTVSPHSGGTQSEDVKTEYSGPQPVSQSQLFEHLHTQPLVPNNLLMSSFLHTGFNMN